MFNRNKKYIRELEDKLDTADRQYLELNQKHQELRELGKANVDAQLNDALADLYGRIDFLEAALGNAELIKILAAYIGDGERREIETVLDEL